MFVFLLFWNHDQVNVEIFCQKKKTHEVIFCAFFCGNKSCKYLSVIILLFSQSLIWDL
jgi:hypothetical protein